MSPTSVDLPPLDDLDKKMTQAFPTYLVRKGYADTIRALSSLPRYISEYLICQHADADGVLPQDAIDEITANLIKYRPEMREKEAFKSRGVEFKSMDIIDHFDVFTDLKTRKYRTTITCIDEKATVDKELVKPNRFPGFLRGGLWGKAKFTYVRKGDGAYFNMCDFESFQTPGAVLRRYTEARKLFTTQEWIRVLFRTAGLNPELYSPEERLLYLCRLIPFVEEGTNIFEMGPSASGKSFLFENLSHYSRMILGGDTTPAKLIYNLSTKVNGLIFNYDVICFDEINKKTSSMSELISKLQQVMASNRVERGDIDVQTSVSLVYQGNIKGFQTDISGQKVPRLANHFVDIPKGMQDYAFLDRIQGYIHGWKLPQIKPEAINHNLGLISNYFGQILHSLRREDFSNEIEGKIKFYRIRKGETEKIPVTIRDKKAIIHLLEGYLKLIFPHREIKQEELREITQMAVNFRQNVIDEIVKVEPNLFSYTLGFDFVEKAKPDEELVTTPEKTSEKEEPIPIPEGNPERTPDYPDNVLHTTPNGLLTNPIPYWQAKLLVREDLLAIKDNQYVVAVEKKSPIKALTENSPPITGILSNPIEFAMEEEKWEELRKTLNILIKSQDKFLGLYQKIQIAKTQIDTSVDQEKSISILKEIEDLEKEVIDAGFSWSQTKLRRENAKLSKELGLMDRVRGIEVNLMSLEKAPIFILTRESISRIQTSIQKWDAARAEIESKFGPILTRAQDFIAKIPPIEKEVLFNGEKFLFFAYDVNNLYYSAREKYPDLRMRVTQQIRADFLPKKGNYISYYFVSKHLAGYQKDIPPDLKNKWFIQGHFKVDNQGQKKYCDVDTLLTAITHTFIEKHHKQIERFTLGSGDKDLHIVCEKAKEYNIPIDIIVVDEGENLSLDLKQLANNIFELY